MSNWINADGSFKELNTAEIEKLSNEQHDDYLSAKNKSINDKIKSLVN